MSFAGEVVEQQQAGQQARERQQAVFMLARQSQKHAFAGHSWPQTAQHHELSPAVILLTNKVQSKPTEKLRSIPKRLL